MGICTLLGYLIGSPSAILTLANHPRTWLIGLVFVLSAGFAREYDGEDLLQEPWYLAIPLGASLVSSLILFGVFYVPSRIVGAEAPPFVGAYRTFLGLFWMTAPLAWLYAVPYERLLDPISAVYANVLTLALVSIWRVALMVRVGVVLFGLSPWAALFRVVAYADSVALVALNFLPFPIIEVMGGVRVSEADMAVRSAAQLIACWGGCSLIVWWLLAIIAGNRSAWALPRPKDAIPSEMNPLDSASRHATPVSWPLRILAVVSLAIWIPILPFTQPEQQLRLRVDTAFRYGRYHEGLLEMSAHEIDDFPPNGNRRRTFSRAITPRWCSISGRRSYATILRRGFGNTILTGSKLTSREPLSVGTRKRPPESSIKCPKARRCYGNGPPNQKWIGIWNGSISICDQNYVQRS